MRTVCLAIMTLAVFISTPAIAKVYKCKDASGAITYSQVPCEKGSSQKTLTTPARTAAPANKEICPLVGDVASRFHTKMRRGASAEDLINRHGSLSGINPRLLGIINYVSGFRHNDTINSQRLGQLATSKCSSGGFGNIQAADLPLDPEQQARQEYLQARKQASEQQSLLQNQKSISVNFQNTPVSQAIQEISRKAGVPMKASAPIAGTVTMKLDNVPWMQPLSAIILQHNLQIGGGVDGMWIAPK